MLEYAALVESPCALPDGLILVFQHPVRPAWEINYLRISQKKQLNENDSTKMNDEWHLPLMTGSGMFIESSGSLKQCLEALGLTQARV